MTDEDWARVTAALREEFDAQFTIFAIGSTPERLARLERAREAIAELPQTLASAGQPTTVI
jgi:hypothetical protein